MKGMCGNQTKPIHDIAYQGEIGSQIPVCYGVDDKNGEITVYEYFDNVQPGFNENSCFIDEFGAPFAYENVNTTHANEIKQNLEEAPTFHIVETIKDIAHYSESSMTAQPMIKQSRRKGPTTKICEYCGLFLKYPSKIANHMRTHTGEKLFSCFICHRSFALNTTLNMHVRRHLNQNIFRCTFPGCHKGYVNASLLKYHVQSRHTMKRKFSCHRGCGSMFFSNEREKHELTCKLKYFQPSMKEIHYEKNVTHNNANEIIYAHGTKEMWIDDVDNSKIDNSKLAFEPQHLEPSLEEREIFYEEVVNPDTGVLEEWVYVPEEYVSRKSYC